MGDLAGALVITPAIVLWGTTPPRWLERRELIHSCVIYAATIAIGLVAFSPLLEQSPTRNSLAFVAILPLMWTALRRSQRDTATTALLISCLAVWGTMSNAGPFVSSSLNESLLLLLTFMISVSVPSLALSGPIDESGRSGKRAAGGLSRSAELASRRLRLKNPSRRNCDHREPPLPRLTCRLVSRNLIFFTQTA
jgi:integral membrane sensor domain MASE1